MDIIMPGMDGLTATKEILKSQKDVTIIAMTSNISADDVASYFANGTCHLLAMLPVLTRWVGMIDLIAKPFTRLALRGLLEKRLAHMMHPVVGQDGSDGEASTWSAQAIAVSTAPEGMNLSPTGFVNSFHSVLDMMRIPLKSNLQDHIEAKAKIEPLRAITNGEVDLPQAHIGQRRDISRISGGAGEGRAQKRQHVQGKRRR
jgi:CheY-like chemotaxis protein